MTIPRQFLVSREEYKKEFMYYSLLGLRFWGGVVLNDDKYKHFHYYKGIIFNNSLLCIWVSQIIYHAFYLNKLKSQLITTTALIAVSSNYSWMNNFFKNRQVYQQFILDASNYFENVLKDNVKGEVTIYKRNLKYVRRLSFVMWFVGVSVIFADCLNSILTLALVPQSELSSELYSNNTVDPRRNIFFLKNLFYKDLISNYAVLCLLSCYEYFLTVTVCVIWHPFAATLMTYIVTRIEILNRKLQYFEEFCTRLTSNPNLVTDKIRNEAVTLCVNEYRKIKSCIKSMELLFSSIVLRDFITFSFMMCLLLYYIVENHKSITKTLPVVGLLFLSISMQWMYHKHCHDISFHSGLTSQSIYMSEWYNYPTGIKKNLNIMMCGSRPITINAVFINVNLETFISIVKGTFSYFTFINNTK